MNRADALADLITMLAEAYVDELVANTAQKDAAMEAAHEGLRRKWFARRVTLRNRC